MGEKPSLSYRQSTGYHSYMFPNNIAFCRPCLSSFIDPRPLARHSRTRRRRRILPDNVLLIDQLQHQSAGGGTRHVLKIARRRALAASFFSGVYSWLVMTFNYLIL